MSGVDEALAAGVLIVLFGGLFVAGFAISRRGSRTQPGRPDHVSDELVTKLMAELRKSQAEANYWKREAERLQKEIDRR